jgi:hypothetical protein
MNRRSRVLAYGSAGALVLVGGICAVVVGGLTGQLLMIGFMMVGLGGALLLAFLDIGLTEERDRAREEALLRRRVERQRRLRLPRRPRRPD